MSTPVPVPDARRQSWLDFEIISISDETVERYRLTVERNRFLWLGLAVLVGGCIHDNGSDENVVALAVHGALLAGLVSASWLRSSLWLKCALMLFGAGLSFLHRELPMPGIGYGFLSSSTHWPADLHELQTLSKVFGLWYFAPFAGVVLFHFGIPVFGPALKFIEAWLVKQRLLPARKHP